MILEDPLGREIILYDEQNDSREMVQTFQHIM